MAVNKNKLKANKMFAIAGREMDLKKFLEIKQGEWLFFYIQT